MEVLKWLLNASLMIAFMFLGMKAQPQKDDTDNQKPTNSVIVRLIG